MAAPSGTNFGSKGALATLYDSSAAFRFEGPKRACGNCCRNFKSAALILLQLCVARSPRQSSRHVTETQTCALMVRALTRKFARARLKSREPAPAFIRGGPCFATRALHF